MQSIYLLQGKWKNYVKQSVKSTCTSVINLYYVGGLHKDIKMDQIKIQTKKKKHSKAIHTFKIISGSFCANFKEKFSFPQK